MTTEELFRAASNCMPSRKAILAIAVRLPDELPTVVELIRFAIRDRDITAFNNLYFAALSKGHQIDAQLLADGACLFSSDERLFSATWRSSGDVCTAIIGILDKVDIHAERQALMILAAIAWARIKMNYSPPPALIGYARVLARSALNNFHVYKYLLRIQDIIQNPALGTLMGIPPNSNKQDSLAQIAKATQWFEEKANRDPLEYFSDTENITSISKQPLQSISLQHGRNDPCPCGSGKKYKKCCLEKDFKELNRSPTIEDLANLKQPGINEAKLREDDFKTMEIKDLLKLDFTKLPHQLLCRYVHELNRFGEYEAAIRVYEEAWIPELTDYWHDTLFFACHKRNHPLVERVIACRKDPDFSTDDVELSAKIVLESRSPNTLIDLINQTALNVLKNPNDNSAWCDLGYSMIDSRWPALGIICARGVLVNITGFDAFTMLREILQSRDRLNLDPEDSAEQLYEQFLVKKAAEKHADSPEFQNKQYDIDKKNEELRKLRQKLVELEHELERKDRLKSSASQTNMQPSVTQSTDEAQQMRKKLEMIKDELKARHQERNELRQELHETLAHLEQLKNKPDETITVGIAQDIEDTLFTEAEDGSIHPTRLPEFPKKFREMTQSIPQYVIRNTLNLVGRLSAGEPSAFVGMKRLSTQREICRQRVGGDHRLLFCLHPDKLEILNLINRRDLDRTLKNIGH